MARFSCLLLVAAMLPFVFATGESSSDCNDDEFMYEAKSCCVKYGGTPSPPTPPAGTQCPSSGWEYHTGKQCCVPHQPISNQPPPQCNNGWEWNDGSSTCCQSGGSSPVSLSPPKPSGKKSSPGKSHKRNTMARRNVLCPNPLEACPIMGLGGLTGDYECLDPQSELESCGGCASTGAGKDCTAIAGVWNVGCEQGRCAIYTCATGYKLAADGQSCAAF
ncbi:Protein priA [Sparassis crispa]|uniref:Protein priA n=1 Tax=Sparassis crispa TaxID=139825 RepID=A0A401G7P6_9APHY|nr:Protein priA [Sparassis crispa]GBE78200.1 Protein priA [Sparassis crispa]